MARRLARVYQAWEGGLDAPGRSALRTAQLVLPFLIIGMVSVGMLVATYTRPLRAAAPFVFSASSYAPFNTAPVCPGDVLQWPVAFTIQRAPVMVISVRSIWDVDANQTATLRPGEFISGALQFTNYTETTSVSRTAEMIVPTLPPGEYQVRAAAQEFNSQAAAYNVPFTIEDGCKPLPEVTP